MNRWKRSYQENRSAGVDQATIVIEALYWAVRNRRVVATSYMSCDGNSGNFGLDPSATSGPCLFGYRNHVFSV
jgi:hypothetical protein